MIDIKELRVGAHINIGGVRHCVSNIDSLNGQIGIGTFVTDSDSVKHAVGYSIADVEPIPITAALLAELGFEKEKEYGAISFWSKDNLYMRIRGERMEFGVDGERAMCVYNIQYLHELEACVYLSTKTELIKED